MNPENQIVTILRELGDASIHELHERTWKSRQYLHRVVKRLLEEGRIQKLGRPPKVYYRLSQEIAAEESSPLYLEEEKVHFLDTHFLHITETGQRLQGIQALIAWCRNHKLPPEKTAGEYLSTRKKYLKYFSPSGLITGTEKLKSTKALGPIFIDDLYYCDFYAIERFGKTKLGTLLHFAKQGQSRPLMNEIISLTKNKILVLIKEKKIEAVGFVPPTIKRQLQIMTVLRKGYNLPLPHLNIVKVSGLIPVPQKSLGKIEERVINARSSILVRESRSFGNVLLIDDAVGSGSTINETASRLKQKGVAKNVYGLAITGSYKGFEVIQEV